MTAGSFAAACATTTVLRRRNLGPSVPVRLSLAGPAVRQATLGRPRSPTASGLRANPCPEVTDLFCRLPLSTLFYQLEAANLGDLMRLSVRPATKFTRSLRFSRVVASAPDTTKTAVLSQLVHPIASQSASRAHNILCLRCEKEKTSLPGTCANVSEFVCVTAFDRRHLRSTCPTRVLVEEY